EVNPGMQGINPIIAGHLTQAELDRCQADTAAELKLNTPDIPLPATRSKGPKYTPLSKRGEKPDAIAYLLRHHTDLADSQICKLIGTTKPTIQAIRDRSHWNAQNIRPQHPVLLGICGQDELDAALEKAAKRAAKRKAAAGEDATEETAVAPAIAADAGGPTLDEQAAAALRSFTASRGA
ncbi:MAG: cell cycle transcriptional regulator TrcR, partial [Pseudomonadota bacterium]